MVGRKTGSEGVREDRKKGERGGRSKGGSVYKFMYVCGSVQCM